MHDALFSIARALNITRPLFCFDLESTGVNVDEDRIVSIAWVRVEPSDGLLKDFVASQGATLINPMRPIPKDASDVHGITDVDVAQAPTFAQLARKLAQDVTGCDLIAFNGRRFDVRLLAKEFERADRIVYTAVAKAIREARIIDPCVIFHKKEARDLTAAYKFYCDRELGNEAHAADADMAACVEVLAAQLVCYDDLPRTVAELHAFCEDRKPEWIDREGKLAWRDGQACLNFGKYQGVSLQRIVQTDASFLQWMLSKDFPEDTKQVLRDALRRKFPVAPAREVA